MRYTYNIHLDERDEFYATVSGPDNSEVFAIVGIEAMQDLIECGFMKHYKDTERLETYLKSIGLLKAKDELYSEFKE